MAPSTRETLHNIMYKLYSMLFPCSVSPWLSTDELLNLYMAPRRFFPIACWHRIARAWLLWRLQNKGMPHGT